MTAIDQMKLATELGLARSQIDMASAGLTRFAESATIFDLPERHLINRANYFAKEALALIDQAKAWAPAPAAPEVGPAVRCLSGPSDSSDSSDSGSEPLSSSRTSCALSSGTAGSTKNSPLSSSR